VLNTKAAVLQFSTAAEMPIGLDEGSLSALALERRSTCRYRTAAMSHRLTIRLIRFLGQFFVLSYV